MTPPAAHRDPPARIAPSIAVAIRELTVRAPTTGSDDGALVLGRLDLDVWWTERLALLDLDSGDAARALVGCLLGRLAPAAGSVLLAAGARVRLGPGGRSARLVLVTGPGRPRRRAVIRWTTDPAEAASADRVVVLRNGRAVAQFDEPCLAALRRAVADIG